jgi:hypothetical protein
MSNEQNTPPSALENAPLAIKLAVDLIQLLEQSNTPIEPTIEALEIVLKDFKNKLNRSDE